MTWRRGRWNLNLGNTMKNRYSEEQIISFLRQAQSGTPIKELCRKYGFSERSFYGWRSKYRRMEMSDAKHLRALEEENTLLKKRLADAQLDKEALEIVLKKLGD